jgi:hypothetical protein
MPFILGFGGVAASYETTSALVAEAVGIQAGAAGGVAYSSSRQFSIAVLFQRDGVGMRSVTGGWVTISVCEYVSGRRASDVTGYTAPRETYQSMAALGEENSGSG